MSVIVTFPYILYFIIFITPCSCSSLTPTGPLPLLTQFSCILMAFLYVKQKILLGLAIKI